MACNYSTCSLVWSVELANNNNNNKHYIYLQLGKSTIVRTDNQRRINTNYLKLITAELFTNGTMLINEDPREKHFRVTEAFLCKNLYYYNNNYYYYHNVCALLRCKIP